jgi:hypothetical protein
VTAPKRSWTRFDIPAKEHIGNTLSLLHKCCSEDRPFVFITCNNAKANANFVTVGGNNSVLAIPPCFDPPARASLLCMMGAVALRDVITYEAFHNEVPTQRACDVMLPLIADVMRDTYGVDIRKALADKDTAE